MALIICPECGGKISDQAPACIHCGFPLDQKAAEDKVVSYKVIFKRITDMATYNKQKIKAIGFIRPINGLGLADAKNMIENPPQVIKSGIPKEDADKIAAQLQEYGCGVEVVETNEQDLSWNNDSISLKYVPKCPTCGSTNIKQISFTRKAIGAATFGLFSKTAKSQFVCNRCGYKW